MNDALEFFINYEKYTLISLFYDEDGNPWFTAEGASGSLIEFRHVQAEG